MKNKASIFMKNIISVISSLVKGKITGVKGKADSMRIRLLVFSLMKSKKFSLATLTNKIQALLDKKTVEEDDDVSSSNGENKAIVLYDANLASESHLNYASSTVNCDNYDLERSQKMEFLEYYGHQDSYFDDDKYPDLTHSLFDDEEDNGGSIIDMVKNSKENEGRDFKLEDEIDHVADLFIKRFRRQMLLQKLDSFKRIQELLGRGA
ncbi:hypothetical protein BVRB_2g030130 [Beta vulgaris subsp. vulgaris]|uniref:uncharacterized protein LOC104908564 n=1 Tax=Beta vulgaris subsp. vulgaris TaxID=3555 RepID=UPI00053FA0FD|nr:uncharacterized protein LOC104908564 [Beta vulgaris subsp. vulgaris]KMT18912.1 hypothetical protein BVRB_2g030130 [Beta vulgaris subsp. vulgaris]